MHMPRGLLALLAALAIAESVGAQNTNLPRDAPTTQSFNQTVVVMPEESCTSQNEQCMAFCSRNNAGQTCSEDCALRIKYCKQSGFYLRIGPPSVKVGKKE
jgi:hypothetical protein